MEGDEILDDGPPKSKGKGIDKHPSPSTSLLGNGGSDMNGGSSSSGHSAHPASQLSTVNSAPTRISTLRHKMAPLMALDSQLADRLSGGVAVSGSGKGGVYVRSGWQARTIESAFGKIKGKQNANDRKTRESVSTEVPPDALVEDVARQLADCEEDIHELWGLPIVKTMIAKRRLKLDEWSELYVRQIFHCAPSHSISFSFLKHISRVASSDYVPTTGIVTIT
jgi:hypothetical protein